LGVNVLLSGKSAVTLFASTDERDYHSESGGNENDEDGTDVQALVVIGDRGCVAVR
jgi:hypothetical protein